MTVLGLSGWLAAAVAVAAAWLAARRGRRVATLAARAAHEVRGPLTAAQLALDGLTLRGEVDAARTMALELQLRRARRALDDLALGVATDRPELVGLADLATELATAWRPVAAARGRELVVQVGAGDVVPDRPGAASSSTAGPSHAAVVTDRPGVASSSTAGESHAVVLGDRTRIAQAVGNLIANALDHGTGRVRVVLAADRHRARISVADDGAGPGRPLAALLAPPWRPPGVPLPPHGHGLQVATEVAARAGGRLTLAGSVFTVELPLVDADLIPPRDARSAGRRAAAVAESMGSDDSSPAETDGRLVTGVGAGAAA